MKTNNPMAIQSIGSIRIREKGWTKASSATAVWREDIYHGKVVPVRTFPVTELTRHNAACCQNDG